MKVDSNIANLIAQLEQIIASECYNPNSYDGWTGEEGCSFTYPVYVVTNENGKEKLSKHRYLNGLKPKQVDTMKFKFGSNHLYIGKGLKRVLQFLEERYDLDFNELEKRK